MFKQAKLFNAHIKKQRLTLSDQPYSYFSVNGLQVLIF